MSESSMSQTLPIGHAAQVLGVTRDNLYKHIERGRTTVNGIPFSAQQGPDKRWKVTIPMDLTPFLAAGQVGQDEDKQDDQDDEMSLEEQLDLLRAEAELLRQESQRLQMDLAIACAERDSYKGMIEATHQATLTTLERVVEKLSEAQPPPEPPALPEPAPEPPKKRRWWFGRK